MSEPIWTMQDPSSRRYGELTATVAVRAGSTATIVISALFNARCSSAASAASTNPISVSTPSGDTLDDIDSDPAWAARYGVNSDQDGIAPVDDSTQSSERRDRGRDRWGRPSAV
jgi:lipoprotein-anchoring transpeptidase ErfK/SrfK